MLVEEETANFTFLNSLGCNAIQWAAQTSNLEMCRYLQRIGLDLKLLNHNGHSALHKAAAKGQVSVCQWLVEEAGLGADHLKADQDGDAPSEIARMEGFDMLSLWLGSKQLVSFFHPRREATPRPMCQSSKANVAVTSRVVINSTHISSIMHVPTTQLITPCTLAHQEACPNPATSFLHYSVLLRSKQLDECHPCDVASKQLPLQFVCLYSDCIWYRKNQTKL